MPGEITPDQSHGAVCMAPSVRRKAPLPKRLWYCSPRIDTDSKTQEQEQSDATAPHNVQTMEKDSTGVSLPVDQNAIDGEQCGARE